MIGLALSPPITVTRSPRGTEATSASATVADGSALIRKLPKSAVAAPVWSTVTVPLHTSVSCSATQLSGWPITHRAPARSGSRMVPGSATPATRSALIEALSVEPAARVSGPVTWNAAMPGRTSKSMVNVELPTCTVIGSAVASGATVRVSVTVTAARGCTAGSRQRVVRPSGVQSGAAAATNAWTARSP